MSARTIILSLSGAALMSACQASQPPLKTVQSVDLEKFMGDWYVIANIPTFIEKGAHNAVESYRLDDDGTVATTFTFRDGSFKGVEKKYTPRGFVLNSDTNAEWGMQFVWPFKGDYRIIYLDENYSTTIIGRDKRDYVWLMARNPELPVNEYEKAVQFIVDAGYDRSQLQRVPQRW